MHVTATYSLSVLQIQLMRQCRIAQYSPTEASLYAAVKSSCFGGISMVAKHFADEHHLPSTGPRWSEIDSSFKRAYEAEMAKAEQVAPGYAERVKRIQQEVPAKVHFTDVCALYGSTTCKSGAGHTQTVRSVCVRRPPSPATPDGIGVADSNARTQFMLF